MNIYIWSPLPSPFGEVENKEVRESLLVIVAEDVDKARQYARLDFVDLLKAEGTEINYHVYSTFSYFISQDPTVIPAEEKSAIFVPIIYD